MDTRSKGASPPGGGGLHGKGCGEGPHGKPKDTLPPSGPPRQDLPRGFFVAGEILQCDLTPAEKLLLGLMAVLSRESGQAYAGVDTYASRLGVNQRTVRRLLLDLKDRGFTVQDRLGGGREIAALYRLNPLLPCAGKPGQFAPVSLKGNPDKSGRKPGHSVTGNPDKTGQKPGQFAPQVVEKRRTNRGREEDDPPAPSSSGTQNGDGNGGCWEDTDSDNALEELFGRTCHKALTPRESTLFREAVAEARKAGATDPMIAAEIRAADRGAAVWDPPNVARETARRLLASYQAVARLPKPRRTLAEIAADVRYARERLARTPQPAPGDEGVALWQAQIAWASAHAAELPAETRRPVPAAAGASP